MKILLDTSVLLNWLGNMPRITSETRDLIEAERNSIFFSPLSIWEVGIKQAKSKLEVPADLFEVLRTKDFAEVRFTSIHAVEAGRLPLIHADPFDRGLIAQARTEGLTLLTNDSLLQRYEVPVLMA